MSNGEGNTLSEPQILDKIKKIVFREDLSIDLMKMREIREVLNAQKTN